MVQLKAPAALAPDRDRGLADSSKYTIPEPASSVLRRQRLLDFLHEHIDHPLQLICAPAGYGKTTLLGDFARDTDLTVCWYAVDELDGDARSFLRHVVEAIKARFPVLDDSVELVPLGLPDAGFNWRGTVGQLISGISRYIPEYFVLVIDDFHIASSNPAVADAVDFLVQHLPDNCRLIISSREMPQLASLPRLISLSRVVGLGTTDLRFTGGEIKALLKSRFGLEVTTEEALRLEQESEGWITSITLTAHPLRKGLFKEVLANRGQNSLLFDYMAAEVFRQQPPSIRQVLLATSICNEFDDELGDALTGTNTSARMLEEVESKNLLMTRLGGPHRWYRYHHLFREFLRDKLRREEPERFRSLHRKAAEHYLAKGEPRQAIHYFLQGSEFDRATKLLEEQVESIAHEGLWETLEGWLQQIPAEWLTTRPKLLIYLSWVHQLRGRNDEAIQVLNRAMAACSDQGHRGLEAQALMRRSVSLRYKGAHQLALRDARRALVLARTHSTAVDQADAHSHLGTAYAQQGKFLQAEKEFRAALAGYHQLGNLFRLSDIHKLLGTVYSNLGQPAKAVTHFELARQGWQKLGNQQQLGVTLNNMAILHLCQGQYDLAEPLARDAISLQEASGFVRNEAYARGTLGEILRDRGDYAGALDACQKSLDLARQCMETHLVSLNLINLSETYRLSGSPEKARPLLEEALALATERNQHLELGSALTSLGIIEYTAGRYQASEALLQRACDVLTRGGQKRGVARARLHLAQVLFLSRRYAEAVEQMGMVGQLCGELGYHQFLVPDCRIIYPLVQYMASRGTYGKFFSQLNQELRDHSSAKVTPPTTREVPPHLSAIVVPRIEVSALGLLQIRLDGKPIPAAAWGSAKAREMFLFMLYKRLPLHKEKIVEALWPEISSSKANSNFHSTLYRMRAAFYPNCVDRDGEMYQLNPTWSYSLDAHQFQSLLEQAGWLAEDTPQRENTLANAVDLYGGPFLEDLDSEWCRGCRTELEAKFLKAVSWLARRHEERREYSQSLALLEKALAVDELQEDLHYRIMDLCLKQGDSAAASRAYRRCLSVFGGVTTLPLAPEVGRLLARLN